MAFHLNNVKSSKKEIKMFFSLNMLNYRFLRSKFFDRYFVYSHSKQKANNIALSASPFTESIPIRRPANAWVAVVYAVNTHNQHVSHEVYEINIWVVYINELLHNKYLN